MNDKFTRGTYNEIPLHTLKDSLRKQVKNLIKQVSCAEKVDGHGAWEFGADFGKRGAVDAVNYDLYAVERDFYNRRLLIVLQVRKFSRRREGAYPQIRKNYFLCGRNEDDTAFAHPITSNIVHAAIKNHKLPIRHIQSHLFACDYTKMIRQGDIGLIPCPRKPKGMSFYGTKIEIQESHILTGQLYKKGQELYVFLPKMVHVPGTHPTIEGILQWYRVVTAKRAKFWKFAAPSVD